MKLARVQLHVAGRIADEFVFGLPSAGCNITPLGWATVCRQMRPDFERNIVIGGEPGSPGHGIRLAGSACSSPGFIVGIVLSHKFSRR
jgi:hypothetical protein